MADTDVQTPLATATSNARSGSLVNVLTRIDDDLLLFDPLNEQICIVPRESATAFLQEANQMQSWVQKLATAREAVLRQEARLGELEAMRFPDLQQINAVREALRKARAEYDSAYAKVKEELGDKGYLASSGDGKEILELLPLARKGPGGKPREWGRKWTYVRSDKIKNHWRAYKLGGKDSSAGQGKSFLKNGRVDTKALREQFGSVSPKLKAEWGLAAGYFLPQLQAWAEQFNVKADESKPVQFSASVHLLRYFAGCGASLDWNPKGGTLAAKLGGKAELNLAYGECEVKGLCPSAQGWTLAMVGPKTGKEFHIGAIRLAALAKFTAAGGASAAAELSLEVDYSDLRKPGVKGARQPKGTTPVGRKATLEKLGATAGAGGDLFAGVRAGGEFLGALQYFEPADNAKFEDMAAIGPKAEVQFGAGAAAAFMVSFEGGKFRMKVKAGVCLGPGAKGEISLEVDAKKIATFLKWFFRALLNAGFEFVDIVHRQAYDTATRLHVMLVDGVQDAYERLDVRWREFQDGMDREDRRVALMNRVLANPPTLRIATPEAHGILLWHLSRHGQLSKSTHLWANSEDWEVLGRRKRAIIQVCRWAQCKSQFENMVQHMGARGEKGSFDANYSHLLRFMEIGPGDSGFDDDLRRLYARLPVEPARGYALAQNHTETFLAQSRFGDAPIYLAQMQGLVASTTALA